jgi:hypothetical protein
MTQSTDPEAGQAFTRASVERYLNAAAKAKSDLESAIADARRRTESALREEERLLALHPKVGGTSEGQDGGPEAAQRTVFPLSAADGPAWRGQDMPAVAVTDLAR